MRAPSNQAITLCGLRGARRADRNADWRRLLPSHMALQQISPYTVTRVGKLYLDEPNSVRTTGTTRLPGLVSLDPDISILFRSTG